MYAIVEIAGKQYKVSKDDTLYIPRQEAAAKDKVTFDRVLLVADGDKITVGTPTVTGASIEATIVEHVKADKVLVFKKKRRKHYKVKNGHRQPYTQIKIEAVSEAKKKATKKAAEPKAEAAAE
ncbi:50S ribosomal protein L21 [bacterium]|nr:50S ribosomal protein L21 [bacterium]